MCVEAMSVAFALRMHDSEAEVIFGRPNCQWAAGEISLALAARVWCPGTRLSKGPRSHAAFVADADLELVDVAELQPHTEAPSAAPFFRELSRADFRVPRPVFLADHFRALTGGARSAGRGAQSPAFWAPKRPGLPKGRLRRQLLQRLKDKDSCIHSSLHLCTDRMNITHRSVRASANGL